ncbi:MAG: type II toxin-antitoxin system VapB family antitoxin [Deltaproteobacteria bacterium]|nr:type II toxin-antitoxin system VapB family antitoxin [Deltaproteobacteria bacterium]
MPQITIDIDENLFQEARRLLGTSSVEETVDAALRKVLSTDARQQEVAVLAEMDGLELANREVMAKAWRSCGGGTKRRQERDIETARRLWREYRKRKTRED